MDASTCGSPVNCPRCHHSGAFFVPAVTPLSTPLNPLLPAAKGHLRAEVGATSLLPTSIVRKVLDEVRKQGKIVLGRAVRKYGEEETRKEEVGNGQYTKFVIQPSGMNDGWEVDA